MKAAIVSEFWLRAGKDRNSYAAQLRAVFLPLIAIELLQLALLE
jgi:hypothetical protein